MRGSRSSDPRFPAVLDDISVDAFAVRTRLFGWNAPDPNLLVIDGAGPPGATDTDPGSGTFYEWDGYDDITSPLEVDGEHPGLLPGSWLVLVQGDQRESYQVGEAVPDGAAKWTLSGPTTLATLSTTTGLTSFERSRARVLAASDPLPAADEPDLSPLTGTVVKVAPSDPPLPRRATGAAARPPARPRPGRSAGRGGGRGGDRGVQHGRRRHDDLGTGRAARPGSSPGRAWRCSATSTTVTHGETVQQVLGSGDARMPFQRFRPRRGPLTYLRDTTPEGAGPSSTVRVDGVAWTEVDSLDAADPDERVYVVQHEDGAREGSGSSPGTACTVPDRPPAPRT